MAELDDDLVEARRDLLNQIRIPELAEIHGRARGVRRRRRAIVGGLAVALLALGAGTATWPNGTQTAVPDPAASAPPTAPGWRADGVTMLALTGGDVLDLPGDVYDVSFATATIGYALARECVGDACAISFAQTTDGGDTWQAAASTPFSQVNSTEVARLRALPDDGILVTVGRRTFVTRPGLLGWAETTDAAPPRLDPSAVRPQLWQAPTVTGGCAGTPVLAFTANGEPRRLSSQPPIEVCRVAPLRSGDGAWWVGGRVNGRPAVAVTRDNGVTWDVTVLPGGPTGAWAEVTTLGPEVYVSVVTPDRAKAGGLTVDRIYRATDGRTFTGYVDQPATMVGDLVPLLDGRLLAANGKLLMTRDRGAPLEVIPQLPAVSSIARTPGAWVGYDVFLVGYVAVSTDGLTWRKINLR